MNSGNGFASCALALALTAMAAGGDFDNPIEASSLDGVIGFTLNGINAIDQAATSVSTVGDVNGDGIDDIAVGAKRADPNGIINAGESYIVFGNAGGFPAVFDLASLDGTNGFTINGIATEDESGGRVAAAGDVNGDGVGDIVIGAEPADGPTGFDSGQVYVVFGSDTGFAATFDLVSLNGANGFVIDATDQLDELGGALASGDVNNDGLSDIILGAKDADPLDLDRGIAYVVFGSDQPFPAAIDLATLDGTNGFAVPGINSGDELGASVSSGDVNGDDIDDVVIGATAASGKGLLDAGRTFVIFGSNAPFPAIFDLATLDGDNGTIINGAANDHEAGGNVDSGSDVNGDGIGDLVIGARGASPNELPLAGSTFVVFGKTDWSTEMSLGVLDGTNGFVINGINDLDDSGRVALPGDINGDGIDDIMIGAPDADPNGIVDAGQSYIVFGTATPPAIFELASLDGTNGFTVNGIAMGDTAGRNIGGAGDVNADGAPDILIGAKLATVGGNVQAGQAYVIYGKPGGVEPCEGDVNGDGIVNVGDLVEVIVAWGSDDAAADVDGDGVVAVGDLVTLIVLWGPC